MLGDGNRPYLLWQLGSHGGGCAEPGPYPEDGTYYSTLDGSTWHSEHLTTNRGAISLTVDVDANRVHAVIDGRDGMVYLTRSGTGAWSKKALVDQHPGVAVIRLDPRTGRLLVAYMAWENDAEHAYVMTYR